jgi:hypothetical protein
LAFNRRTINKELDLANLNKHNDNYADIETTLDAHDVAVGDFNAHIANGNLHTTLAEKTKLAGITAGAGGAGSASDSVIGNRTIADTTAPTGDTGTITTLLGWLANMIKAITGKSSWRTAPATTLEAANTHMNNSDLHTSVAEHTKLAGIQAGAEVNQNTFAVVAVTGQSDVVADAKSDTLTLAGGTGITITTDATTDKVVITATGEATPGAHASSHLTGGSDPIPVATTTAPGLMSAEDRKRIDTEVTTDVILSAGQQILNATKNARLQGLKVQGRSLINRQINGGFNDSNADGIADSWSPALAGASATVVNGKYSKAQRITSTVNDTLDHRYLVGVNLQLYANKKYIALVDFENDGTTQGAFRFGSPADATSTTNTTMYIKKAPTIDETSYLILFNQKAKGAVGWVQFEGARIYEISDADYAAIDSMTSEQVAQRWPYVPPGINGVDGLYVRRYGRNLLPPFTDKAWSFNPNAKANGPYQSVLTATAEWQAISCAVPVMPGKTYYLSIEGITANSGAVGSYLDSNKKNDLAVLSGGWIQNQPLTVPEGYYYILINLASNQIGTYNFNNPQLELGSVATPF